MPNGTAQQGLAGLLMLIAAFLSAECLAERGAAPVGSEYRLVVFAYRDISARTVCVAGSFNGWSPTRHCLTRDGAQWSVQVQLKPGRYEYVLVRNGSEQLLDPNAQGTSDSGFGKPNSVLYID